MRAKATLAAVLASVTALGGLAGCGYEGAKSLPLPGAIGGDDTYAVTMVFTDATNLVPKETCRANDTVVGSVESVELDEDLNAEVVCRIRRSVSLPANVTATLRETSLLGERYVALDVPAGDRPRGELRPGTVVPASETLVHPNTEMVLGALSQVLNGGGLASLRTITRELNDALDGRTGDVRSATRRLDVVVGDLDANREAIVDSLVALDRLSGRLADQRGVIADTLETVPEGLRVLDDQRPALTRALRRLSRLSRVVVPLIEQSRANTVADLRHLRPVLTQLNTEGDQLAHVVDRLVSFPFPTNTLSVVKGDYAGMYAQISFDIDSINKLLASQAGGNVPPTSPPPGSEQPALPELPGLPGLPGLPELTLESLGLDDLGLGATLAQPGSVGGQSSDTAPETLADLLTGGQ